jgi:proline iminopeptidase
MRPDVKLPYRIQGKGAPILMLAGGPGFTSDYLRGIIDKVGADKYRWILLEQRGTPRARLATPSAANLEMRDYVDDLEALRNQLKLRKWTVAGQSWGSVLAEAYVAAHPDRVTSLILLNTPGPDLEWLQYGGDNINRALNAEDRKAVADAAARNRNNPDGMMYETFVANLPAYVYSRAVAEKNRGLFKPGCVDGSTINFVFANLQREKWDVTRALGRYHGPALVIQGRQDFLGESAAIKAARAMPKGELQFIERAGHIAWLDNPAPFFSRLSSFLRRNAK